MSKGLKIAIGVVAAIAIPFVAPMIAGAIGGSALFAGTAVGSFLGGAGGSALVGAGLGAASAAATGKNPLLGAALGGVGGFAGGGGFSGLFGGGTGAAAAAPAATAATTGTTAAAAAPAVAGAVAPAAGISIGSLGSSLASAINPSNLAQLALVMYGNSNTDQLDSARKAALQETAELATRDRGLFEQRVEAARRAMQQAEANPQTAYAQAAMSVERRLQEAQRGAPAATQEANMRRAGIEAARIGTAAAQTENARSIQGTQTATAMLPTQAPLGYSGRVLPIYEAMQKREDEQMRDIARAIGGTTGGTRQAGLFSLPT
jgi:hypothetical protein